MDKMNITLHIDVGGSIDGKKSLTNGRGPLIADTKFAIKILFSDTVSIIKI